MAVKIVELPGMSYTDDRKPGFNVKKRKGVAISDGDPLVYVYDVDSLSGEDESGLSPTSVSSPHFAFAVGDYSEEDRTMNVEWLPMMLFPVGKQSYWSDEDRLLEDQNSIYLDISSENSPQPTWEYLADKVNEEWPGDLITGSWFRDRTYIVLDQDSEDFGKLTINPGNYTNTRSYVYAYNQDTTPDEEGNYQDQEYVEAFEGYIDGISDITANDRNNSGGLRIVNKPTDEAWDRNDNIYINTEGGFTNQFDKVNEDGKRIAGELVGQSMAFWNFAESDEKAIITTKKIYNINPDTIEQVMFRRDIMICVPGPNTVSQRIRTVIDWTNTTPEQSNIVYAREYHLYWGFDGSGNSLSPYAFPPIAKYFPGDYDSFELWTGTVPFYTVWLPHNGKFFNRASLFPSFSVLADKVSSEAYIPYEYSYVLNGRSARKPTFTSSVLTQDWLVDTNRGLLQERLSNEGTGGSIITAIQGRTYRPRVGDAANIHIWTARIADPADSVEYRLQYQRREPGETTFDYYDLVSWTSLPYTTNISGSRNVWSDDFTRQQLNLEPWMKLELIRVQIRVNGSAFPSSGTPNSVVSIFTSAGIFIDNHSVLPPPWHCPRYQLPLVFGPPQETDWLFGRYIEFTDFRDLEWTGDVSYTQDNDFGVGTTTVQFVSNRVSTPPEDYEAVARTKTTLRFVSYIKYVPEDPTDPDSEFIPDPTENPINVRRVMSSSFPRDDYSDFMVSGETVFLPRSSKFDYQLRARFFASTLFNHNQYYEARYVDPEIQRLTVTIPKLIEDTIEFELEGPAFDAESGLLVLYFTAPLANNSTIPVGSTQVATASVSFIDAFGNLVAEFADQPATQDSEGFWTVSVSGPTTAVPGTIEITYESEIEGEPLVPTATATQTTTWEEVIESSSSSSSSSSPADDSSSSSSPDESSSSSSGPTYGPGSEFSYPLFTEGDPANSVEIDYFASGGNVYVESPVDTSTSPILRWEISVPGSPTVDIELYSDSGYTSLVSSDSGSGFASVGVSPMGGLETFYVKISISGYDEFDSFFLDLYED